MNPPATAVASWPPVALPTARPRRPGVAARRTATASMPRAGLGAVADELLLAGFAAVFFRHTGQRRFAVEGVGYAITDDTTLRELADGAEPAAEPGDDAEFRVAVRPDGVAVRFDPRLFDQDAVARLLDHVRTLVADAIAAPDRPVARLRLLPDAEAHRILVDWNRTATDLPHDACLHGAFEAAANRAPDAVAVVDGGRRWTCAEIDAGANRLARHLRGLGVGHETRVGVCLDRSAELLVAVLGVMKAGGAYVPLDPDYPRERLATMIAGTSCAAMVSRADLAANLPPAAAPVVLVDRDADAVRAHPANPLDAVAGPDSLCYVIHTSGSTGTPKPIALRHRGVLNNIADLNTRFDVGPGDAVLALSSPSFDMSVYEFLGITAAGGTVVVPDRDRAGDPDHWVDLLGRERVTVWNSAPVLLGMLADRLDATGPSLALRLALLGGDWVPVPLPDRVRAFAPGLRVVVMGGATEASIHSTIYEVGAVDPDWPSIPYGRPMANQRAYILDAHRQPVPPGVPGELYLAGIGLARGYLDQPERTAERFTEWSYIRADGTVIGDRVYRTGDIARFGQDGLIELLGRADFQVKINGVRVELGEIEAVLRRHPAVRRVVVVAPDKRLTAYVVPAEPVDRAGLVTELTALAARRLPVSLVPAAIVPLDELPLTPNGKLDRARLPAAEPGSAAYRAPLSTVERVLAGVFADVLGVPRIGVDDDFLAMGGDSVKAVQAGARARAAGVGIGAGQVLRLRTIAALAPVATTTPAGVDEPAGPLVVVGPADLAALGRRYPGLSEVWPLTPTQSGMLFESMLNNTRPDTYRSQVVYHLSGPVDADRLHAVTRALVDRHASLRAAFVCDVADTLVQVVVDGVAPPWRELDLTALPDAERDAAFDGFLAEDRAVPFDPAVPPLLRLALVRLAPRHARLVLTVSHLLLDGWSQQVLADELVRGYVGEPLAPVRPFSAFLTWLSRRDPARAAAAWAAELAGVDGPTTLVSANGFRRGIADIAELTVPLSPGELTAGAGRLGVTANTVVRGALAVLLAALTGRDDVVFGATVAGRPEGLAGVESMVGLFLNLVPVRARVEEGRTVRELLADLQRRQADLLDHQHHGLAEIHRAGGLGPLFDTMIAFQSYPRHRAGSAELTITRVDALGVGSYPLSLLVDDDRLTVQYDRNHFDQHAVTDLAARFRAIARRMPAAADRPVATLDPRRLG